MPRKKKGTDVSEPPNTVSAEATAEAEVPEAKPVEASPAQTPPPEQNGKPKPNRPAAAFAANSDRQTRIEVAVWGNVVKVSESEEYTQYSLTLSRTWRSDKDGNWRGNGSFRIHDVPVLLYLVEQAYHWCVAQRTTVRIESTEPLPF